MGDPLILVTGAVGSKVVEQLVQQGRRVRVLTRDAEKAAKFGEDVDVATGGLGLPDTLAAAFAGVSKAFVLASNDGNPNAAWEASQLCGRAGPPSSVGTWPLQARQSPSPAPSRPISRPSKTGASRRRLSPK